MMRTKANLEKQIVVLTEAMISRITNAENLRKEAEEYRKIIDRLKAELAEMEADRG